MAKTENTAAAAKPWEGIMTKANYDKVTRDLTAKEKQDFDYDKFFRASADVWLLKDTLQNAYKRINNVHPMGYLRVNCTLQQYDEFLDFYGITEGDGMYLAPEDRVAIW